MSTYGFIAQQVGAKRTLYGARSMPCTMYPVSVSAPSARPPPWSAPIVGSSIMSTCDKSPREFAERIRRYYSPMSFAERTRRDCTVFSGSSWLHSHAHDATSVTNMRGGRMTCMWRLRTRWCASPPVVAWIRSTPTCTNRVIV